MLHYLVGAHLHLERNETRDPIANVIPETAKGVQSYSIVHSLDNDSEPEIGNCGNDAEHFDGVLGRELYSVNAGAPMHNGKESLQRDIRDRLTPQRPWVRLG